MADYYADHGLFLLGIPEEYVARRVACRYCKRSGYVWQQT